MRQGGPAAKGGLLKPARGDHELEHISTRTETRTSTHSMDARDSMCLSVRDERARATAVKL